jgi:beta-N-acetylhexosaminidase
VVPAQAEDVSAVSAEVQMGVGGIILYGSSGPEDLAQQLAALEALAPPGEALSVMTDEEGGSVQRLSNLVGPLPSARQMAATLSPQQIQQLGLAAGERLRAAGVTVDLAPVLDLDGGPGPSATDPDGTRSFSTNAATAAADGIAFAQGLIAAGVTPVVKHFPGLGSSTGNTDDGAASTIPYSQLKSGGLLPFATAVSQGLPAVMVANASVPGLTDLPATISSAVIQGVLRQQLHFQGLVMTDSLSAAALSVAGYSVPQAAVAALRAGADLLLFNATSTQVGATTSATIGAIVAAVQTGSLPRSELLAAVSQVLAFKGLSRPQPATAGGRMLAAESSAPAAVSRPPAPAGCTATWAPKLDGGSEMPPTAAPYPACPTTPRCQSGSSPGARSRPPARGW